MTSSQPCTFTAPVSAGDMEFALNSGINSVYSVLRSGYVLMSPMCQAILIILKHLPTDLDVSYSLNSICGFIFMYSLFVGCKSSFFYLKEHRFAFSLIESFNDPHILNLHCFSGVC